MATALVVGGGGIGVASAYYLARDGWSVTLLDRGELGRGCSYGNSCLVVPSHSEPIPGPGVIGQAIRWMARRDSPFYVHPSLDPGRLRFFWEFRKHCNAHAAEAGFRALLGLSRASIELYEELLSDGATDFFFERRGLLEVFLSDAGLEQGRRAVAALTEEGFDSRMLTADEAVELEPALAPGIRGGLFTEGEAHGYSYGYLRSLAETTRKLGVRIETARGVETIRTEKGHARGVTLDDGERLDADIVVLAAGAWSGELAGSLGIDLPMQPAKGYSATIDTFDGAPSLPILVKERRVIVTPLDGRVRFGGTLELMGFDSTVHGERYRAVIQGGRDVLRVDPPLVNEEPWSGLRPVTPDGLPVISRAETVEGLIVATGHAMLGFTQSPITGKLVAELASEKAPSVPIDAFRLDRF